MNQTTRTAALLAVSLLPLALPAQAASTKPFPPAPTGAAALAPPADPDHFTFVVSGDNRSTGHGYPMPPALDEICREIGLIHPPFTLWTGDVIEGYGDSPAEANAEYDTFLAAAAKTGTPLFNCPGNHEFSLDKTLLAIYKKRMGPLYGSFDYGHSHFVALNTTSEGPDGTLTGGKIDDAQLAWLQSDLEASKNAVNTFVFMHHYVFGPPDADSPDIDTGFVSTAERDKVHALMVKYKVRAVFCGHNHIFWHKVVDGVEYYISGGAGAPLDASPENGGYLHYLTVAVDGPKVTTQILQPWHLNVQLPDGPAAPRAWVTNTNNTPVTMTGVVLHCPAPPAGQSLHLTAGVAYKKKVKPGAARILSQSPDGAGGLTVRVEVIVPEKRTTELSLAPGAP